MATIRREFIVSVTPAQVWDAVRDVGAAHKRLFPGVLVDARMDGDARIVTFANGLVLREVIVTVDDAARRLVYSSVGGSAKHHNSAIEVLELDGNQSRVVWITDVLPKELAGMIEGLMTQGAAVMKKTLEAGR